MKVDVIDVFTRCCDGNFVTDGISQFVNVGFSKRVLGTILLCKSACLLQNVSRVLKCSFQLFSVEWTLLLHGIGLKHSNILLTSGG